MAEKTVKEQIDEALGGVIEKLNGAIDTKIGGVMTANKALSDQLTEMAKNHKILADTIAAIPPAAKAAEKKEGDAGKADQPKFLTAEDLVKTLDAREATRQASATKTAARQKVIDAKLKDVPVEFHSLLPDTDNEADLLAGADKVIARVNDVLKVRGGDLGGGNKDGGTLPGSAAPKTADLAKNGALPPGQAKFASAIKGELAALNGGK